MAMKALTVAMVAGVLLVGVIGLDAAWNVEYVLEQKGVSSWRELARHPPEEPFRYRPSPEPFGADCAPVDNRTMELRLRVINDHPWGFREDYEVFVNSQSLQAGTLSVPARGEESVEFSFSAADAVKRSGANVPEPKASDCIFVGVEVYFDDHILHTSFSFKRGSA